MIKLDLVPELEKEMNVIGGHGLEGKGRRIYSMALGENPFFVLTSMRRTTRFFSRPTRQRARRSRRARRTRRDRNWNRKKGGGIGETVREYLGIPIGKGTWVTDGKGVSHAVDDILPVEERANTSELPGDDDI